MSKRDAFGRLRALTREEIEAAADRAAAASRALMPDVISPGNAKEWANLIATTWRMAAAGIIKTGERLIAARAALPHGEFLAMIEGDDFPFGISTADKLMAIARNPVLTNSEHVPNLPPSWGTLYALSKLPDDVLRAGIAHGAINPGMKRSNVRLLKGPPKKPTQAKGPSVHISVEMREKAESISPLHRFQMLVSIWQASSPEERQRFLAYIKESS